MSAAKGQTANMKYDFTGLNQFIGGLEQAGQFVIKVGIFGEKNPRREAGRRSKKLGRRTVSKEASAMTNSEVGFTHEMGSPSRNIPQRSFLRMPLSLRSKEILDDTRKAAAQFIARGEIKATLNIMGAACIKQIQLAFSTWGFGRWPANRLSTVERKGSNSPLIDTAQLRRSVTYKVEGK